MSKWDEICKKLFFFQFRLGMGYGLRKHSWTANSKNRLLNIRPIIPNIRFQTNIRPIIPNFRNKTNFRPIIPNIRNQRNIRPIIHFFFFKSKKILDIKQFFFFNLKQFFFFFNLKQFLIRIFGFHADYSDYSFFIF